MAESAARTSRSARSAALSDMSGLALQLLDPAEQVVHAGQPFATGARVSLPGRRIPGCEPCVRIRKSRGDDGVGGTCGHQVGPLPSRVREALSGGVEIIGGGGGAGFVRQLAQACCPTRHLERRSFPGFRGFSSDDGLEARRFGSLGLPRVRARRRRVDPPRPAGPWSVAVCPFSACEGEGAGSSKVSVDMGESICSESTVAAARIISAVRVFSGFTGGAFVHLTQRDTGALDGALVQTARHDLFELRPLGHEFDGPGGHVLVVAIERDCENFRGVAALPERVERSLPRALVCTVPGDRSK